MNLSPQSYYLILYDISDDKRRRELFKLLKTFGANYQYSAFELRLDPRQFVKLRAGIKDCIDSRKDRVAILKFCQTCHKQVEMIGLQSSIITDNVVII